MRDRCTPTQQPSRLIVAPAWTHRLINRLKRWGMSREHRIGGGDAQTSASEFQTGPWGDPTSRAHLSRRRLRLLSRGATCTIPVPVPGPRSLVCFRQLISTHLFSSGRAMVPGSPCPSPASHVEAPDRVERRTRRGSSLDAGGVLSHQDKTTANNRHASRRCPGRSVSTTH